LWNSHVPTGSADTCLVRIGIVIEKIGIVIVKIGIVIVKIGIFLTREL